MHNQLIPTKITVPPPRDGYIQRDSLLDKLNAGLRKGNRFTLISSVKRGEDVT